MIEEVLAFWFEQNGPEQWWTRDPQFDAVIRSRFEALHARAVLGELDGWRDTPEGRLAEIIVLDQFSRNLYRDDPRAFAADGMALALAQEAVRTGADQAVPPVKRQFFYMPYQHSESPRIHEFTVALFEGLADPESLELRAAAQGDHRSLRSLPSSQPRPRPRLDRGGDRLPSGARFVVLTNGLHRPDDRLGEQAARLATHLCIGVWTGRART